MLSPEAGGKNYEVILRIFYIALNLRGKENDFIPWKIFHVNMAGMSPPN